MLILLDYQTGGQKKKKGTSRRMYLYFVLILLKDMMSTPLDHFKADMQQNLRMKSFPFLHLQLYTSAQTEM